jgi:hypothetical protein
MVDVSFIPAILGFLAFLGISAIGLASEVPVKRFDGQFRLEHFCPKAKG